MVTFKLGSREGHAFNTSCICFLLFSELHVCFIFCKIELATENKTKTVKPLFCCLKISLLSNNFGVSIWKLYLPIMGYLLFVWKLTYQALLVDEVLQKHHMHVSVLWCSLVRKVSTTYLLGAQCAVVLYWPTGLVPVHSMHGSYVYQCVL